MVAIDQAALMRRSLAPALVALLVSGCVHLPPLLRSRDALDPQEHARLGSSYEAQGQRAEAVAQYEAAVDLDPGFVDGWVALGNVAFTDGQLEKAEGYFRKAVAAGPHHAGACNNLAMTILARGGDLKEAESLATEALGQAGPLRPYILDTLANIQLKRSHYAEALEFVGQAEAAAPEDAALVRAQLKATRDAIMNATKARDHAPGQEPKKGP